jgi:DNA-binding PadR family transcriptional regulator
MKIMAVVCYNCECGQRSYGYDIWKTLKDYFHIYLRDGDIRNVYHHLKDLCDLDMLAREEVVGADNIRKCFYNLTERGRSIDHRYAPYLEIVRRDAAL